MRKTLQFILFSKQEKKNYTNDFLLEREEVKGENKNRKERERKQRKRKRKRT